MSPTSIVLVHAHALFRLRPLRFSSFTTTVRPLAETGHPLDHDVRLRVRSHAELTAAPDLRRFADWATQSRSLDYLEQA